MTSRFGLSTLSASLLAASFGVLMGPAYLTQAAVVEGGKGPQLLIGRDDDNIDNAGIQAGALANQSLNRTDIIDGGPGNDVIFGLNGDDVIDGGPGLDIILGGPDGGVPPGGPPNSDIMFGGPGNDVNLWAPGDGSEAFIGGPGLDAVVFGGTDREAVPDLETGVRLPTLLFGVGRVSAGHTYRGREWSGPALHRGAEPVTRLRLPGAVPRAGRQHYRHGAGERGGAVLLPEQGGHRDRVRRPHSSLACVRRRFAARGRNSEPARRLDDSVAELERCARRRVNKTGQTRAILPGVRRQLKEEAAGFLLQCRAQCRPLCNAVR